MIIEVKVDPDCLGEEMFYAEKCEFNDFFSGFNRVANIYLYDCPEVSKKSLFNEKTKNFSKETKQLIKDLYDACK